MGGDEINNFIQLYFHFHLKTAAHENRILQENLIAV